MSTRKDSLEVVTVCGPTEAEMIREVLENNGIESTLQGEVAAQTLPAAGDLGDVRILVTAADAGRATELIEAFFEGDSTDAAS